MDPARKRRMFDDRSSQMGFKEIEVGFPSASQPDFDFVRQLIEEDLIPDDVTIQVLTQCRPELIERTYECLHGAHAGDRPLLQLDVGAAAPGRVRPRHGRASPRSRSTPPGCAASSSDTLPGTDVRYEYSPESFTGTEIDYAVEICEAVMDVIEPDRRPAAHPEPAGHGRDVHAEHLRRRHRVVPPHTCATATASCCSCTRTTTAGCAVAAAEFGVMAGADRVEGTLFGNGERTGNVDVVTLAMNLFSQGVDPELDITDIDALRRVAEYCNRLPVHPRHPYVGDLVYTAFSGIHQDAIKKGFAALRRSRLRRRGACRTCRSTRSTSAAPTRRSSGSTASPARAASPTS